MTRVLILGAGGMLGHKLCQQYRHRFDTWATVRSSPACYARYDLLPPEHLLGDVDAFNIESVAHVLDRVRPDVIINCIGIIKQLPAAHDPIASLTINALFPHHLARLCRAAGVHLIHLSTDCVFSGRKGGYSVDDVADAEDLYGRTKFLGEVGGEGCLTLRTSIIGRELETASGLLEWFLGNERGRVQGYTHAIFSGLTSLALASVIATILEEHPSLSGLYHVASRPISKYELLVLLRQQFSLDIEIEPDAGFKVDRSLDASRFWQEVGWRPPSWPAMIRALAQDPTPYRQWRTRAEQASCR